MRKLIFIHGLGADSAQYHKLLAILKKQFEVFIPDLPSHGTAELISQMWHSARFVAYFQNYLDVHKIDKAIVVGHSLGGLLAYDLSRHDNRITECILLNPALPPFKESFWKLMFRFTVKKPTLEALDPKSWATSAPMCNVFFQTLRRNKHNLKPVMQSIQHLIVDTNVLPFPKVPVTMLWGLQDAIFPRERLARIMQRIPKITVIPFNGNHSWPITDPSKITLWTASLGDTNGHLSKAQ